jgi:hypothetical protein
MATSLAMMNLMQHRERYPYDGAALARMPGSQASRQAERLGMSSVGAAALAADAVERDMLRFESKLVRDLGSLAGRDLSHVDVQHIFVDSPNAITFFDPNDQSYAIGIDPGYWQAMGYLYWDAAIGQRVNDPRWFLVMASKTVAWFWTARRKAGRQIFIRWSRMSSKTPRTSGRTLPIC